MDVILHLGGSGKAAAVKTAESAYLAYDDVGIENVGDAIKRAVVLTTTTGQPMTIYLCTALIGILLIGIAIGLEALLSR